jgi:hypothetical protein
MQHKQPKTEKVRKEYQQKIEDLCMEVGEGVTVEERPTLKQFLKQQQQRKVLEKLKGTLGMDGLTKSVNK